MRETFDITGMTCAACSARVQRSAGAAPRPFSPAGARRAAPYPDFSMASTTAAAVSGEPS